MHRGASHHPPTQNRETGQAQYPGPSTEHSAQHSAEWNCMPAAPDDHHSLRAPLWVQELQCDALVTTHRPALALATNWSHSAQLAGAMSGFPGAIPISSSSSSCKARPMLSRLRPISHIAYSLPTAVRSVGLDPFATVGSGGWVPWVRLHCPGCCNLAVPVPPPQSAHPSA